MKRIIALLLAALLMVSCALADVALRGYDAKSGYVYVTLGQCPQDADGGVEPIVWRVLSVEDGRAYLPPSTAIIRSTPTSPPTRRSPASTVTSPKPK